MATLNVFFRDIEYLWNVAVLLIMYMSAIFYSVDGYPPMIQKIFLLNPVYCNIKYVRAVVIDGYLPSLGFHALLLFYGVTALLVGGLIYKKYNTQFLYYV